MVQPTLVNTVPIDGSGEVLEAYHSAKQFVSLLGLALYLPHSTRLLRPSSLVPRAGAVAVYRIIHAVLSVSMHKNGL